MNKVPKPRTSLGREELLQAMEPERDLIPEDNYDQFIDQVYSAIAIYLDLDEPSMVAKELREVNRICQKPNYTLPPMSVPQGKAIDGAGIPTATYHFIKSWKHYSRFWASIRPRMKLSEGNGTHDVISNKVIFQYFTRKMT